MSKLRIAQVGCGGMGNGHLRSFAAMKDEVEIVWCCDPFLENAEKAAEQYGGKCSADYQDALDDVDAVSVATPHHTHAPISLEAMNVGKHVMVEKPMANTREECEAMIEAAEKNGVVLQVGLVMRYHPVIQMMREVVQAGTYGEVIMLNHWTQGYLVPDRLGWAAKMDQLGGGTMFSHGCHYVDLIRWILGEPTRITSMGTRLGADWMEGDGTTSCIMQFPNGGMATYQASWAMKTSRFGGLYHVHCTDGFLECTTSKLVAIKDGEETALAEAGGVRALDLEMQHFVECICEGKDPDTDGREALASLELIWRMDEANQKNAIL